MSYWQVPLEWLTERAIAMPVFACSWTQRGRDAAWVQVAGELDLATVPQLHEALSAAQSHARLVVLDLRGLVFLDSSGVHAIASASRQARRLGRRLVLLRGPSKVDRLFTLTGSRGAEEIAEFEAIAPSTRSLL